MDSTANVSSSYLRTQLQLISPIYLESTTSFVSVLTVILVIWCAGLQIVWAYLKQHYNTHFHPLSRFRGPKEAVVSRNWVHGVLASGKAEETFGKLHAQYNVSALRVAPNELHINDVSAYKSIYCFKTPYTKDSPFYDGVLTPHTLFAETDIPMHNRRRRLLDPPLSKKGVQQLEPVIESRIKVMGEKFLQIGPSQPVNIYNAFRCLTLDIITTFSFGHDSDITSKSDSDFRNRLFDAFDNASPGLVDMQESWIMRFIASKIPMSVVAKVNVNLKEIHKMQQESLQGLKAYKNLKERPSYPVILDTLQDLSNQDQAMQAVELILGGTDTSAFTLAMGIFRILGAPEVHEKLVACVDKHVSEPGTVTPLVELEKIDYLWAVSRECLRVAMPIRGRLPRIVPKNAPPLIVDDMVIPPGTVVGMSAHTMNSSPEIWGPDAASFRPERWLSADGTRDPYQLGQHLSTFSKGLHQCIGRNLAEAEITMVLAYMFRTFSMISKTRQVDIIERFTTFLSEDIKIELSRRTT